MLEPLRADCRRRFTIGWGAAARHGDRHPVTPRRRGGRRAYKSSALVMPGRVTYPLLHAGARRDGRRAPLYSPRSRTGSRRGSTQRQLREHGSPTPRVLSRRIICPRTPRAWFTGATCAGLAVYMAANTPRLVRRSYLCGVGGMYGREHPALGVAIATCGELTADMAVNTAGMVLPPGAGRGPVRRRPEIFTLGLYAFSSCSA